LHWNGVQQGTALAVWRLRIAAHRTRVALDMWRVQSSQDSIQHGHWLGAILHWNGVQQGTALAVWRLRVAVHRTMLAKQKNFTQLASPSDALNSLRRWRTVCAGKGLTCVALAAAKRYFARHSGSRLIRSGLRKWVASYRCFQLQQIADVAASRFRHRACRRQLLHCVRSLQHTQPTRPVVRVALLELKRNQLENELSRRVSAKQVQQQKSSKYGPTSARLLPPKVLSNPVKRGVQGDQGKLVQTSRLVLDQPQGPFHILR